MPAEPADHHPVSRPRPVLPVAHVYSATGFRPQPSVSSPSQSSRHTGSAWHRGRAVRPNLLIETRLRQADTAGELQGGARAYAQALSLAKFRCTSVGLRRTLNSPRGDPSSDEPALHFVTTPWFTPGRTKLRDVDPRKRMYRPVSPLGSDDGREHDDGGDFTRHFECSGGEATRHEHVKDSVMCGAHYTMTFLAGVESSAGHTEPIAPPTVTHTPVAEAQEEEAEGSESDDDAFFETGASMILRRSSGADVCDPRNHTNFMREQVYRAKCESLSVSENSGVMRLLKECVERKNCYCNLRRASFRNLFLGDRGMLALLPLLTFARKLRCLDLSGNGMRSQSVKQFCAILHDPNVLHALLVLDLSGNPLGATCAEELLDLLLNRAGILMLGARGTQMSNDLRQRLLRQSLANFASAELSDMEEAVEIARRRKNFSDLELVVRCQPIQESAQEFRGSPRSMTGTRSNLSLMRGMSRAHSLYRRFVGSSPNATDAASSISEDAPGSYFGSFVGEGA